jgi:hypothetical protein
MIVTVFDEQGFTAVDHLLLKQEPHGCYFFPFDSTLKKGTYSFTMRVTVDGAPRDFAAVIPIGKREPRSGAKMIP